MNTTERETSPEYTGVYLGRLGDFGLGSEDGIPSKYAETGAEELQSLAEKDAKELVAVTNTLVTSCIDGRPRISNADGSLPERRYRRVSGSAANFGVALNADAPIARDVDRDAPLGAQIAVVDAKVGEHSAHLGGCGGANGEVADHELIHENDDIMKTTKSIMEIEPIKAFFGTSYEDKAADTVHYNAGVTATHLRANGWDGETYVQSVVKSDPQNVETLEVDENDHIYHGHKESKIVLILGDKTSEKDHEFVWNLQATKTVAHILSDGDEAVYQRVIIAEVAKHVSVCHRLSGPYTPLFLLSN